MVCLSAKPVVDGIERAMRGQGVMARANIQTPAGRALRERHAIRLVPTLVLFDGAGREVWRHEGFPDRAETLEQVRALSRGK